MENGLHYMAVAFAMQLVKLLLVDECSVSQVTEADLFHTIEALMRTSAHPRGNAPEGWVVIKSKVRIPPPQWLSLLSFTVGAHGLMSRTLSWCRCQLMLYSGASH